MDEKINRVSTPPTWSQVVIEPMPEIEIASWCPDNEAKAPPEQVHMFVTISGLGKLAVRFKSPATLGWLITELARYRNDVWPEAGRLEIPGEPTDLLVLADAAKTFVKAVDILVDLENADTMSDHEWQLANNRHRSAYKRLFAAVMALEPQKGVTHDPH